MDTCPVCREPINENDYRPGYNKEVSRGLCQFCMDEILEDQLMPTLEERK